MGRSNIHDPEWEADFRNGTPARSRVARVGAAAGASALGSSVYEIEPGGAVSPYHAHHGNEELLFVLAGEPSLRTPEGIRRLATGEVVAFVAGAASAHRVFNPSDAPARVLIVSTMRFPEVVEYPTVGTTLAMTGPGRGTAFPAGAEGDYRELVWAAWAADSDVERDAG